MVVFSHSAQGDGGAQPTRPSLAGATRILNRTNNPAVEKFDGGSAHRRAITPEPEHGLVSIEGPNGLVYSNTVDTFGAGSAGGKSGPTSKRTP